MKYTRTALGALLLLIGFNVTTTPTRAQVEKAVVRVDGMSCPFCAYGLEKKMKKIEGTEEVSININNGTAELLAGTKLKLDIDALRTAVKDAGFTPREITITVSGTLTAKSQGTFLDLPDDSMRFVLFGSDEFLAFAKSHSDTTQKVRVVGNLAQIANDEKQDTTHYAITVETFEDIE